MKVLFLDNIENKLLDYINVFIENSIKIKFAVSFFKISGYKISQ